ncbi:hypothetical protein CRG98_024206 [Punica granatum]|uniref:Uncharacterized protein n=1 Tax=Punica granatum TaxID=22663 RepID=A0A2I0JHF1_PUNGR|nr:hypothetical protein CRG98_024206 [Punica granatum]
MADEAIHNHPNAEEQEVGAIQALEQRIERMERTLERRFEQRPDQRHSEFFLVNHPLFNVFPVGSNIMKIQTRRVELHTIDLFIHEGIKEIAKMLETFV